MGFEIIEKGTAGQLVLGDYEVSIGKYTSSFGPKVAEQLRDMSYVEVYIDYDGKRIGFKGTTNSVTGFKIGRQDTTIRTSCNKIQSMVTHKRYNARIESDGMVVIDVPDLIRQ